MTSSLSDLELDALRELANIASGTAATALAQMLGRPVELTIPRARALDLGAAVEACGAPEEPVCAVILPVHGDSESIVVLLIKAEGVVRLSELLGVIPGTEVGESALCEIGNILGASYLRGLSEMTGLELLPNTPHLRSDMLGAILSALLVHTGAADSVLIVDSELDISGEATAISFLMLPSGGGVEDLLAPLGLTPRT